MANLTGFALKAKKQVNYMESGSEGEDDDDEIFRPSRKNGTRSRIAKRRKTSPESDGDFEQDAGGGEYSDDGQFFMNNLR